MSFAKRSRASRLLFEARSYRVNPGVTLGFISEYLESLDCPRALSVAILFRNGEHEQLAALEFNPLFYRDVKDVRDAYQATKFLSKYKDLILGYDLDQVAMEKFEKFEQLCGRTNARFRKLECDPKFRGRTVRLHTAVQRKISKILGEFDAQEFFDLADWGPGATTLLKARDASSTNKFQCETGITRDLYALLPLDLLKKVYPLWASHLEEIGFPNFQTGNKVVTVPKDATANRVIAIEPGINLWFQKALGSMLQRRLRRWGIDLRFQSRNQLLALEASKDASLATVDFSSASDSIARGVIDELFLRGSYKEPSENNLSKWHSVFDSCRSHYGLQGKTPVLWNKFSSMGNGFTFQLESLLFFAIASCCVEEVRALDPSAGKSTVSVYGDDVIIPVDCLELFSVMCDFYGFVINMKKTHFSSFFRESCGSHYMMGRDVKPIYFKSRFSDVLSVYRAANAVRRFAHRSQFFGCDARHQAVFDHLVNSVPKPLRGVRIPETLGDGGFISNWDEATPQKARHGIEGYYVSSFVEVGKTYQSEGVGLLLDRLWTTSLQERRNNVTLRGRTKLRFSRSLVRQWYDLGPWI